MYKWIMRWLKLCRNEYFNIFKYKLYNIGHIYKRIKCFEFPKIRIYIKNLWLLNTSDIVLLSGIPRLQY